MNRYLFRKPSSLGLEATKRWASFLTWMGKHGKHRYFITLTPKGGAKANPEAEAKKFAIALSNSLKEEIYVEGACWDKTCDSRKNTHSHLIVGSKTEIKLSVVKKAWNRGIIHFQPYDDSLNGFTYIFRGSSTKLPHMEITWKSNIFKPSIKRLARFSK